MGDESTLRVQYAFRRTAEGAEVVKEAIKLQRTKEQWAYVRPWHTNLISDPLNPPTVRNQYRHRPRYSIHSREIFSNSTDFSMNLQK